MESTVNDSNMQGPERMSRSLLKSKRVSKQSPSRHSPSRRSPGRPRKNSPTRSSRRSPARRSPARRSPGRRSPVKHSPTSKKDPIHNIRIAQVSLSHTDALKKEDKMKDSKADVEIAENMEEVTKLIPIQSRMKEPAQITRRSTRILSNMIKNEYEQKFISTTRNVDRAVSLPVDRRVHMYDFTAVQRERGLSMQTEQDVSKILHYEEEAVPDSSTMTEKSKKEIELVSKPQEWGGWIGALCLIFVLPIVIILPQIACFNNQCNIGNLRIPTKLQSYLNLHAIGLYTGFLSILALASLLPVGKLIDGQQTKIGRLQYRMNGIILAVLMIIVLAVFEYKGYATVDFILNSCLQLSVTGWILGTVLAIGLYVKGDRVSVAALNMYGSTNNFIYDFWQGREVNPRIGQLDVKVLLLRANVIGTLMLNSAVIAKLIHDADSLTMKDLNLPALIVGSLQIFYCLDYLVFESALLTSFKILYEGTGYLVCVGNLLNPFLLTLSTRYLLHQKTNQSIHVLTASVAMFFVGYAIYRMSNSQKNEFRKNPFSPALSYLDTISTSRGKRIITSGFWGYVRHPNYFGDIIIHWSMACAALSKALLPYYAAVLCTVTLMYRAIRDDRRCRHRYGSSWEQYCLRVKSMIVDRVF